MLKQLLEQLKNARSLAERARILAEIKAYVMQTGPRGGKFYYAKSGRKIYRALSAKSKKKPVRIKDPAKQKKNKTTSPRKLRTPEEPPSGPVAKFGKESIPITPDNKEMLDRLGRQDAAAKTAIEGLRTAEKAGAQHMDALAASLGSIRDRLSEVSKVTKGGKAKRELADKAAFILNQIGEPINAIQKEAAAGTLTPHSDVIKSFSNAHARVSNTKLPKDLTKFISDTLLKASISARDWMSAVSDAAKKAVEKYSGNMMKPGASWDRRAEWETAWRKAHEAAGDVNFYKPGSGEDRAKALEQAHEDYMRLAVASHKE